MKMPSNKKGGNNWLQNKFSTVLKM